MTGKLKYRLANAALGAIVTHALVNKEGTYIVAAESGQYKQDGHILLNRPATPTLDSDSVFSQHNIKLLTA